MESVDFLQCARLSILRAEKENGYLDVASILGPAFVWERSANVPAPSLTKAQHGCCGSLSSTNVHHLRATARFSSHCTEVRMVASHVSHRCASHSPHTSSNIRAIYQLPQFPMKGKQTNRITKCETYPFLGQSTPHL